MSNKSKKALGQFYTTNNEYILQNITIPDNIFDIIEPFAGNSDLIAFIENAGNLKNIKYNIECLLLLFIFVQLSIFHHIFIKIDISN